MTMNEFISFCSFLEYLDDMEREMNLIAATDRGGLNKGMLYKSY